MAAWTVVVVRNKFRMCVKGRTDKVKGWDKKGSQGCPKVWGMRTWVNGSAFHQDVEDCRKSKFRRGK